MFSKFIGAAIVCLVMFAALACRSSIPAPTLTQPTVPTPQATAPVESTVPATGKATGTVSYRERIALTSNAVLEVKLLDVSRADAPAVAIGAQVIENPGQVPIAFEIEYNPSDIDQRLTYAVRARIMDGDKLAFINDTAYTSSRVGTPTMLTWPWWRAAKDLRRDPGLPRSGLTPAA